MSDQTIQQPTIISRKWLRDHGACREQAELFERVWPDGVAVTRENLEQSATAGLSLEWFAEQVLPRSDYDDYQAQRYTLFAAYQAQRDMLFANFQAQRNALYAALQSRRTAAHVALYTAYKTQIAPLGAAYHAHLDTLHINAVCNLYGADAPAIGEGATCNSRR